MPSSPSSPIKDAAAAAADAAFADQHNNSPAGKLTPVRPSRLYDDGDDDESRRKAAQNPSPSHGCHSPSKKILRPSASSSKHTPRDLGAFEPTAIDSVKAGSSSVTLRSVLAVMTSSNGPAPTLDSLNYPSLHHMASPRMISRKA